MSAVTDVPALLRALRGAEAANPRLTWYGPGGERIELSGRTLENWVTKTVHLLQDECDAEPGLRLAVRLPTHWRTVVWLLAAWQVGAHVRVLTADDPLPTDLDVLVSDRPEPVQAPAVLLAVALPALATRFAGDLPAGAVDAAEAVRLQPDAAGFCAPPLPTDAAFSTATQTLTYADLSALGAELAERQGPVRRLTGAPTQLAAQEWLAVLLAGGSLVLHPGDGDPDAAGLARIAAQEAVST